MKKSEILSNVLSGVLVLCALVITALVVRREFLPAASAGPPMVEVVSDWRSYASAPHSSGSTDAPVTIVEFSDFQCPYCRVLAARFDTIRAEFPGQVNVVYRHFPLDSHRHALAAATASECAGDQGRFWPMHDVLFRGQPKIGASSWQSYASAAAVPDTVRFTQCMSRRNLGQVRDDMDAGHRLGVISTPTLLVNEHKLVGAPPLDSLRAYVGRAVASRRAGRSESRVGGRERTSSNTNP